MDKTSAVMNAAVAAIRSAGGSIYPEKGGWWRSAAGNRISYDAPGYSGQFPLGTNTVYALARRGLLQKLPEGGNRDHSAYCLKS